MTSESALLSTCLPPGNMADAVLLIANRVRVAGGRAYLVGGGVRDALLGEAPKDLDLEVYGLSAEALLAALAPVFQLNTVGASFGVIKIANLPIDIALPRVESKAALGHRGFLVDTCPNLPFDLACARRDFTINAILLDPLSGGVIDPWGGRRDLEAGILRHVSDAFGGGPLRVLRAVQFAARFAFVIAPETVALCRCITPENLPHERLAVEWEKLLLRGRKPSLGLAFLRECGWIRYYPELVALVDCPQYSVWHPEGDVWAHTLHAVDALPFVRTGDDADDLLVAVSVLCHDFGKPRTTVRQEDGRITSHGHEVACEWEVRTFVARLWNLQHFADRVVKLVTAHMYPLMLVLQNASDRAYRRLAVNVDRMDLLAAVVECDMRATPPNPPALDILAAFKARAKALAIDKAPPRPMLLGRHLIERGLTPGPAFGEILRIGYEHQLKGSFTDEPSALAFLDALLAAPHTADDFCNDPL